MFTDAQGRKWRYRIFRRDGSVHYSDSGVLGDGEQLTASMMMADSAMQTGGASTMNDTILNDAQRRFEDAYGPGGACLVTFSERAKALHLIGDADSNEVFRVEQAMAGLRSMAFRMQMAADSGGTRGMVRDSADDSLKIATFLTRMADRAHGRADALRAGQSSAVPERFDARQQQRISDARAHGGDRAASYEAHKAALSNAWMRNR